MKIDPRAESIIKNHVLWSMGAGLVPVPLVDVAAVTAIQIDMLRNLAGHYEADFDRAQGKAFISSLTGSTVARIGASMIKALPVVGTLIGGVSMSVLSGATTYAIGEVVARGLESGRELLEIDIEHAREVYEEAFDKGRKVAQDLRDEGAEAETPPRKKKAAKKRAARKTAKKKPRARS